MKIKRPSARELLLSLVGSILLLGYLSVERFNQGDVRPPAAEPAPEQPDSDRTQKLTSIQEGLSLNSGIEKTREPDDVVNKPSEAGSPYQLEGLESGLLNLLPDPPPGVPFGSEEHLRVAKAKNREVYFQRSQSGEVLPPHERFQEKASRKNNPYQQARTGEFADALKAEAKKKGTGSAPKTLFVSAID